MLTYIANYHYYKYIMNYQSAKEDALESDITYLMKITMYIEFLMNLYIMNGNEIKKAFDWIENFVQLRIVIFSPELLFSALEVINDTLYITYEDVYLLFFKEHIIPYCEKCNNMPIENDIFKFGLDKLNDFIKKYNLEYYNINKINIIDNLKKKFEKENL